MTKEEINEIMSNMAWHEAGHAVMAIVLGLKVKKVYITPFYNKGMCRLAEGQVMLRSREWLVDCAGRAWEVLYGGRSVKDVVDDMIKEKGQSDWIHLGKPSRAKTEKYINETIKYVNLFMSDEVVKDLSQRIHDAILKKGVVGRRELVAIGKECHFLVK